MMFQQRRKLVFYKKYFEPWLVFSPILVFCALIQYKTHFYSSITPEWYKMSTVIQQIYENGDDKSTVFMGNSFTQSGINPRIINEKEENVFVFGRGGTPSVELLFWLYKNNIFPKTVALELNSRELTTQYFAGFDLLKPETESPFDLWKNKVEVLLRFYTEKGLTFLSYKVTPKDCWRKFKSTHSICEVLKLALAPKRRLIPREYFHNNGFIENPPHLFTAQDIEKNTKSFFKSYKAGVSKSRNCVNPTLELWSFLIPKFLQHKTSIILFRLPKGDQFIEEENRVTATYFSSLKQIAEKNKGVCYLDFSGKEYRVKFSGDWLDGAHWSNQGAKNISTYLKSELINLD